MSNTSTASASDRTASAEGNGKPQWRIRTEKGDTFGPADLATLKSWALDGRLAPTHQVSCDGQTWVSVTSLPELEMDWVAEVTSGSFYGPIHKHAMTELIKESSVSAAAPLFQRSKPQARAMSEHEQQLENRVRELQQQLASRVPELEQRLSALRGELEQSRSALGARDLEFDAERQEHKAALARLQAEILKRDGRIAALETDVPRTEQLARERQELEAKLSDAERRTADHTRLTVQQREELDQARALQREAERHAAQLKERLASHEHDREALQESVRSLKLRFGSARKLLQQASASLAETDAATDAEIVTAPSTVAGLAMDGPPPLASPAGSAVKPGMSLADLEAQAQRELRQLGNKGGPLFKGRAKG